MQNVQTINITKVFENPHLTVYEVEIFNESASVTVNQMTKEVKAIMPVSEKVGFKQDLLFVEKAISDIVSIYHYSSLNKSEA